MSEFFPSLEEVREFGQRNAGHFLEMQITRYDADGAEIVMPITDKCRQPMGLLIAPAATVYLLSDRFEWLFWGGGLLGAFGSCAGLLLSYWFGLPSGPCIALLLGLIFGVAYLFGPRYGVLPRLWRRKRHFHTESLERWQR